MNEPPKCDRFIPRYDNASVIPGYEGIPQNLLVNVIAASLLLILFAVLRKLAWDYGRIALAKPEESRWTSLFYSELNHPSSDTDSVSSSDVNLMPIDHGFCSWIRICFTLKNDDLRRKAGSDAVQYLRFELHLLFYTAITMVLCLVVILPLNIHGELKSADLQQFGVTTIANLGPSPVLWAHLVLGLAFFLFALALMYSFSRELYAESANLKLRSRRTLMISGISRSHCHQDLLRYHFSDVYPSCPVQEIEVCYDIQKLIQIDTKREYAKTALKFSEEQLSSRGERPLMLPCACGWTCLKLCQPCHCFPAPNASRHSNDEDDACCGCHRCPHTVDAIDYYTRESMLLQQQMLDEVSRASRNTLGIAFVTFATAQAAHEVERSFNRVCCPRYYRPRSMHSKKLRTSRWTVQFAPTPRDILWSNLTLTRTCWWLRAVLINLAVFIVVFFLTTPTYVLNLVNELDLTGRLRITNQLLIQFIPSIILWSVSALLPFLVYRSDDLIGHWTRSEQHLTVMGKTYTLLIFMVLLLPSLGLTSIPAVLRWLFRGTPINPTPPTPNASTLVPANSNSTTQAPFTTTTALSPSTFQWECVFMPDNGAFFVNYVITSAFLGLALQLVRFPELVFYACRILCVRSEAEKAGVRKSSQYEFPFGINYAWNLCVFAVISTYSILCPLITPFGLIYLALKYLVDRYNLYFAYRPSRVDYRTHRLATIFMLSAVLLLQLNLFMFVILRLGALSTLMSIAALLSLLFCGALWIGWLLRDWVTVGLALASRRLGGRSVEVEGQETSGSQGSLDATEIPPATVRMFRANGAHTRQPEEAEGTCSTDDETQSELELDENYYGYANRVRHSFIPSVYTSWFRRPEDDQQPSV